MTVALAADKDVVALNKLLKDLRHSNIMAVRKRQATIFVGYCKR
jgi:hypothetical protein